MEGIRAPNYELALADYQSGMKYKDIAQKYGVSINTVKSWKTRYKWSKDTKRSVHTKQKKVCTQRGGQPGNKNAAGHGGTGPPGNKNAVKTGEFETLFFDTLEPEERELIGMIQLDKEQLLLQEIQLLTVRERRMLKRIEAIKDPVELLADGEELEGMTAVKIQKGIEKGKATNLKECQGKLGQIQAVEDALTRVQARKQKAIDSLHRFGFDDARLEIELMKVEVTALKLGGQESELEDDGFLSALNAEAEELWSDVDGNE